MVDQLTSEQTDTIDYVATDTNGLTSTRTVLIEPSAELPPLSPATSTAITTTASSQQLQIRSCPKNAVNTLSSTVSPKPETVKEN